MREHAQMNTGTEVVEGRGLTRGLKYAGAAAIAVTLLTGSLTAADAKKAAKDITIALVLNDLTNPVSLPLRKGAEDAAAELGFKLITVGPSPSTAQGQIALLETMPTQGANGVILLPVDSEALVPAINATVAGGIPVATTELDASTSKRSPLIESSRPSRLQARPARSTSLSPRACQPSAASRIA
jgi:ribose transport system substrate-binding protein